MASVLSLRGKAAWILGLAVLRKRKLFGQSQQSETFPTGLGHLGERLYYGFREMM